MKQTRSFLRRFCMAMLFAMLPVLPASAAGTPISISMEDLYIFNVGDIQLRERASAAEVSEILGEVLEFFPGKGDFPMYVVFEGGTVWFSCYGDADMETEEEIMAAIFTKEDVFTVRGIHIGDDAASIRQTYGQPARTSQSHGIVDTWYKYHAAPLDRLCFGVRHGRVTAIAVNLMAGGV